MKPWFNILRFQSVFPRCSSERLHQWYPQEWCGSLQTLPWHPFLPLSKHNRYPQITAGYSALQLLINFPLPLAAWYGRVTLFCHCRVCRRGWAQLLLPSWRDAYSGHFLSTPLLMAEKWWHWGPSWKWRRLGMAEPAQTLDCLPLDCHMTENLTSISFKPLCCCCHTRLAGPQLIYAAPKSLS